MTGESDRTAIELQLPFCSLLESFALRRLQSMLGIVTK
jgi:hypothetical protein